MFAADLQGRQMAQMAVITPPPVPPVTAVSKLGTESNSFGFCMGVVSQK